MISFFNDFRDLLVDTYGDEMIDMHQQLNESGPRDEGQIELPFNGPLEF